MKVEDGILGLAVADALGVPVEFTPREILKKSPMTAMMGHGTFNKPAGTWSDDTSMTLCLLDSLSHGIDPVDVMKKFKEWLVFGKYTQYGNAFDIGITCKKSNFEFY